MATARPMPESPPVITRPLAVEPPLPRYDSSPWSGFGVISSGRAGRRLLLRRLAVLLAVLAGGVLLGVLVLAHRFSSRARRVWGLPATYPAGTRKRAVALCWPCGSTAASM